jgi:hypothetical protein
MHNANNAPLKLHPCLMPESTALPRWTDPLKITGCIESL